MLIFYFYKMYERCKKTQIYYSQFCYTTTLYVSACVPKNLESPSSQRVHLSSFQFFYLKLEAETCVGAHAHAHSVDSHTQV